MANKYMKFDYGHKMSEFEKGVKSSLYTCKMTKAYE